MHTQTTYCKNCLLIITSLLIIIPGTIKGQKIVALNKMGDLKNGPGNVFKIKSATEINALHLMPGDTVMMQNGAWENTQLLFKANGNERHPIVLTTETPGSVILSGNANLQIDGQWLTVDGLYFTNGYSLKEDVIVFSKTSQNCRLTNTSIIKYNPPDKKTDYKWVSIYGAHNQVDHCEFTDKIHQGTTVVVWLSEKPNYHNITNNYFGPRPPLGNNGGESIRVGTSEWSMHDSYTNIEHNIFDNCDGETEIISIKSCRNTIQNNLFYECDGTLTLRHGNSNLVTGNYFIGNKKQNTGGIRIIGENHTIKNNYLYALTGTNLRAAISVMNAVKNPKLNEYWQVKNAIIDSNIIVDCKEAFAVGSGKNETRVLPTENVTITNNYIINPGKLISGEQEQMNLHLLSNKVKGTVFEKGFEKMKTGDLEKNKNNFWQWKTNETVLFWLHTQTGPKWNVAFPQFKIQ